MFNLRKNNCGCRKRIVTFKKRFTKHTLAFGRRHIKAKPACSGGTGETRALIVCLDYEATNRLDQRWRVLDTSFALQGMRELVDACGVTDVTVLNNDDATCDNVLAAIEEIGGRCGRDDFFVIYYTGHGAQLTDEDEEEEDGLDEAWCLVDEDGNCDEDTWLRDDDFVTAIISSVPEQTRVVVLSDSCHSGTMCDFDSASGWVKSLTCCCGLSVSTGHHAACLSGCLDKQLSAGTGKGGVFSNSMFLAIDKLQQHGKKEYSIGRLYNAIVDVSKDVFNAKQSVYMSLPVGRIPAMFAWPLVPTKPYESPLMRAARIMGANPSLSAFQQAPTYGISQELLSEINTGSVNAFFYGAPTEDSVEFESGSDIEFS
eukprot:TRINITY_DN22653_c0_g1_i1.p1 TRINITY_DN22653_c0_g1~~TRINITY_DN22653_c0_g1_i1.p1  ORF type:complete len:371 (+),score=61.60 TRINITY_DN22653_c0_g1_i1:42-1154(+)